MKLYGKRVLILVADGVEYAEITKIRSLFEQEGAAVYITAPSEHMVIESIDGPRHGSDILLDFPLSAVDQENFDALVVPDGLLAANILSSNQVAREVLEQFFIQKKAIIASGAALNFLESADIRPSPILVRDGEEISDFFQESVGLILDAKPVYTKRSKSLEH